MADNQPNLVVSIEPCYPSRAHLLFGCLAVVMMLVIIVELVGFPRVARAVLFTIVILVAVAALLCLVLASDSHDQEEE